MPYSLLLLDDEVNLCRSLGRALQRDDLSIDTFSTPNDALEAVRSKPYAVALVDLMMPGMSGLDVLKEIRRTSPDTLVLIMTAYATIQTAVEAMRSGAFDYLQKPFTNEEARRQIDRALQHFRVLQENRNLREQLNTRYGTNNMIGASAVMQETFRIVERVATSSATVLITGESGTGKELIARALHTQSPRNSAPFVAINCGAIPSELLESELFGYEKGAFTGAHQSKRGLVEQADSGTLFLDEISELLPRLQVKLLRMLQEREIQRLGGEKTIKVDVRVVAATNADLRERIAAGEFREDLYYRLNVVSLRLPPLRERIDDVLPLVHHFLRKHDPVGRIKSIDPMAAQLLRQYRWPGNVRELENVIERACLLARGEAILPIDLPPELSNGIEAQRSQNDSTKSFSAARDEFERFYIVDCLRRHNGNVSRAAREAGLQRQNFYQKLHKYNIQRRDYTG
ncbi:MAG: sigma-54-dependent Fis family transcriptional regulator [Deltaproteobacteria bacterium]|nr:sigma-54-dependent Fis family transcriptional regulator [Deltaproteobacteria bacterium]